MSKTWFITGASSGFGRSMIERLLARGDRVAAASRNAHALDDRRAKYGDRLWVAPLDLRDRLSGGGTRLMMEWLEDVLLPGLRRFAPSTLLA